MIMAIVIKESGLGRPGQAEQGATNVSILLRFGHQPSHFWSAARTHGLEYKYKKKIRRNTITTKYMPYKYKRKMRRNTITRKYIYAIHINNRSQTCAHLIIIITSTHLDKNNLKDKYKTMTTLPLLVSHKGSLCKPLH